jgi:hypothetical protein
VIPITLFDREKSPRDRECTNVATILEARSAVWERGPHRCDARHHDKSALGKIIQKEYANIFDIYGEVARDIAAELKIRIAPDETDRLGRKATENMMRTISLKVVPLNRRWPGELAGDRMFQGAIALIHTPGRMRIG